MARLILPLSDAQIRGTREVIFLLAYTQKMEARHGKADCTFE